jgi:hypothetical protein
MFEVFLIGNLGNRQSCTFGFVEVVVLRLLLFLSVGQTDGTFSFSFNIKCHSFMSNYCSNPINKY